MTPEQRRLCFGLALRPAIGRELEPAGFLVAAGVTDGSSWAREQMASAIEREDADDAEAAMVVGAVFGFDTRWSASLVRLLETDWHGLHEGAAHELGFVGGPEAVPALVAATRSFPAYLEHDRGAALSSKAIHALGKIEGEEATRALVGLRNTGDEGVRDLARRVLDRRVRPPEVPHTRRPDGFST